MITATTKGIDATMDAFSELTKNMQTRVASEAVTAGSIPIVRAAKRYAQRSEDTGNLRESIGLKLRNKGKYTKQRRVFSAIGPRSHFRGPDGRVATKYAHLIEFGHVARDGTHVAAKPFMRPAWAVAGAKAKAEIEAVMKRRIPEEAAKAARRAARKAAK